MNQNEQQLYCPGYGGGYALFLWDYFSAWQRLFHMAPVPQLHLPPRTRLDTSELPSRVPTKDQNGLPSATEGLTEFRQKPCAVG